MPAYLQIVNKLLSLGAILLQIITVILFVNLILFKDFKNKFFKFFNENVLLLGFIAGLSSVVVSLFYSQIVGYPPCELCWVQRIFLYPQMILFGLGLYKKDWSIVDYSLIFAILGSLVSIYHTYIESGGSSSLSCATGALAQSSGQTSCVIRYVYEFGYITIPVMCLTLSLFIIAIILNKKYSNKY